MNNFTSELIAKAKAAANAEELFEIAKANNVELTEEEAKAYFDQLSAGGTVSDDDLNDVAGGGSCPGDEEGEEETAEDTTCTTVTHLATCPYCGGVVRNASTCKLCPNCKRIF